MNVTAEIELLNINSVALRNAADEQQRRVDEVSRKAAQSPSRVRQNLKKNRVAGIALFYMKRKLS